MESKNLIKTTVKILLGIMLLFALLICFNIRADIPVAELKQKYTNAQSKFISIDGLDVHYRDEGTGMPIILVHGTAASLHTWDDWTKQLQQNYRVIRLDLPAFGLTGPNATNDYSIKTYTSFLNQFLEKIAIDSFHLAGNSLGGEIAWNYAATYPEKVDKLVLVDPAGYSFEGNEPPIIKLANTPIINRLFSYVTPRFLISKNLREVYYDDSKISDELIDRYHQFALRKGNRAAFLARVQRAFVDHTPKLKTIQTPTLVIWGENDEWIPLAHGKKFVADMPNAQLVVLEKTGHVPMEERPKESLAAVLTFFK